MTTNTSDQSLDFFYDGRFLNMDYSLKEISVNAWPKNREEACVKWISGGGNVLEVGFGDGNLLYTLSKKFSKVYGVEVGVNRIAPMTKAFQKMNCHNVQLQTANVEHGLPFENNSMDCIIWLDVIEHVVDVHAAMNAIHKVLKPGGTLVTSTPNIAELRRRIKLLFGKFPSTAREDHEGLDLSMKEPYDRGHLHYFTQNLISEIYRCHGFSGMRSYGFGNLGRLHNLQSSLLCGTVFMLGEKSK